MKGVAALLMVLLLLTAPAGAMAIATTSMSLSDTYDFAFFYLDSSGMLDLEKLTEAEKRFSECANSLYEFSDNYKILTDALISTANEDYEDALLRVRTLKASAQSGFIADLETRYGHKIGTLQKLNAYIDGRRHEKAGVYAKALSLYEQCKILDVSTRIIMIRKMFPARFQNAKALAEDGKHAEAAAIMKDLANAGYTDENKEAKALLDRLGDWDKRLASAEELVKAERFDEARAVLAKLVEEGYAKAENLNACVFGYLEARRLIQKGDEASFLSAKGILAPLVSDRGFNAASGLLQRVKTALDHVSAARAYEEKGDYDKAEASFEQAASFGLNAGRSDQTTINKYLKQAQNAKNTKRYAEAAEAYLVLLQKYSYTAVREDYDECAQLAGYQKRCADAADFEKNGEYARALNAYALCKDFYDEAKTGFDGLVEKLNGIAEKALNDRDYTAASSMLEILSPYQDTPPILLKFDGALSGDALTNAKLKDLPFNAKFYYDKYSDLRKRYGYNEAQLKEHWLKAGAKEGRQGSPVFDVAYYKSHNPDIGGRFTNDNVGAMLHWWKNGVSVKEGRQSAASFSIIEFMALNPDIAAACGYNVRSCAKYYNDHYEDMVRENREADVKLATIWKGRLNRFDQ